MPPRARRTCAVAGPPSSSTCRWCRSSGRRRREPPWSGLEAPTHGLEPVYSGSRPKWEVRKACLDAEVHARSQGRPLKGALKGVLKGRTCEAGQQRPPADGRSRLGSCAGRRLRAGKGCGSAARSSCRRLKGVMSRKPSLTLAYLSLVLAAGGFVLALVPGLKDDLKP